MIPTNEAIEAYAEKITQDEPELLYRLSRETYQKVLRARMISGHLQGRVLSMIAKLTQPQHILEVGTYTGYSALCLAEGLAKDGQLHTLDKNEELFDLQHKYFSQSAYADQIHQHLGDALEIIPTLEGPFDLVFLDADKKNYINYYNLLLPKLKSGGLLITDNVLWYGKVTQPTKKGDKDTALLKEFNQMLHDDDRVENVLLPIRDGILLTRKK